jgi:hypothetical protein
MSCRMKITLPEAIARQLDELAARTNEPPRASCRSDGPRWHRLDGCAWGGRLPSWHAPVTPPSRRTPPAEADPWAGRLLRCRSMGTTASSQIVPNTREIFAY